MSTNPESLTPVEKEELDTQLAIIYGDIFSVSDEVNRAKRLGEDAIAKAQNVESGLFKRKKAIESLKDASVTTADATLATLNVVNRVSENQQRMATACKQLLQLGAVDIATNRAVIASVEKAISDGSNQSLAEEVQEQLIGVIRDLKQREDFLIRQQRQGDKLNEHEHRLAESDKRSNENERKIYDLHQKNIEQDERLRQGEKKNLEQDERLRQGEKKDFEQDAFLEDHRQRESEQEKIIADLESRVKALERSQKLVSTKRTMLYWAISISIGLIGVLLGIIALLK